MRYTGGTPLTLTGNAIGDEFYDFYRTPRGEVTPAGASAQTTTMPTLTSNVKFMNFYPFNDIESISPRPLLFITGALAHSREFSEDAYKRAGDRGGWSRRPRQWPGGHGWREPCRMTLKRAAA